MNFTINGQQVIITIDETTGMITVLFPNLYLTPAIPVSLSFAPMTGLETIMDIVLYYLATTGLGR